MCKSVENCSVCLKTGTDLVSIWQTDVNNIKWSSKLLTCVPEVVSDQTNQLFTHFTFQLIIILGLDRRI